MRPLEGFWRIVTTLGAMGHALAGWRHILGEEAHLAEPFLRPMPETASSYPCDPKCSMNNGRRIVEHGPDDAVAICRDDRCTKIALRSADIVRWQSDINALSKALLGPLGLASRPVEDTPAIRWWRVGAFLAAGGLDVPVLLSTSVMPRELRAGVDRLLSSGLAPFIVLVARPETIDLETAALLKRSRCAVIALKDVIGVDDAKRLAALRPIVGTLEAAFGRAASSSVEPENIFRLEGEAWMLKYEGKTALALGTKGLSYIRQLLGAPHRRLHASQLHAAVAGAEHVPTLGSAGEVLDREALAEYRERLRELAEEAAEASRDDDLSRCEEIEKQRQALVLELSAATGLGGRQRKAADDVDRVRRSISTAITRDVERIGALHPALAKHLGSSIDKGEFFSYGPERDVTWTT